MDFSRPIRTARDLLHRDTQEIEHLLNESIVLVRVDDRFRNHPDVRETVLLTVNQVLRFCPNVNLEGIPKELKDKCGDLAGWIHGQDHCINNRETKPDVVINIGTTLYGERSVTINSSGWVCRSAAGGSDLKELRWDETEPNPLGAVGAACLGSGIAFLLLLGLTPPQPFEISLYENREGGVGTLHAGPALRKTPLELDSFLIGCGSVMHGWAYAIRLLPIVGSVNAVDRERFEAENQGSYVCAGVPNIDQPKAELLREFLSPKIDVIPRIDEFELFRTRLKFGLDVPPLIVAGVDNVETRQSVQRLWPGLLIDMGAGGLNSQVLVRGSQGLCMLKAFTPDENELSWAQHLSRETGLSVRRIMEDPTSPITSEDVESASPEHKANLEEARSRGQLICGRLTDHNLNHKIDSEDFAPAVPFVTTWSGLVAAAETVKALTGRRYGATLHYQRSFLSHRSRSSMLQCTGDCECRHAVA